MSDNTASSNGGVGVLGLLGVTFIILKLTHVIDWSWWLVTLPFWGGFALFISGFVIFLLVHTVIAICSKRV